MRASNEKLEVVGHVILRVRLEAFAKEEGISMMEALRRIETRAKSKVQVVERVPDGAGCVMPCSQTRRTLIDIQTGCARCGVIVYHSPESCGQGIVTFCAPCYDLRVQEP